MTAADIDAIREKLKEASRYIQTGDDICCTMTAAAMDAFFDVTGLSAMQNATRRRLKENLDVALNCTHVDMETARGYFAGAIHELGCLRSDLERQEAPG
jgi:hypothetical protein